MPAPATQPDPAEGAREDDAARPDQGRGEGVSAQAPAEGSDDAPGEQEGSPQG